MKLKTKVLLLLSAFFVLFLLFALGTILIFERMGEHMTTLRSASEENRIFNELENDCSRFFSAVVSWAHTGDARYRKEYRDALAEVYKGFGNASEMKEKQQQIAEIGRHFQEALEHSRAILAVDLPVGDRAVEQRLMQVDRLAAGIARQIDDLQELAVLTALSIASRGDEIRSRMVYYHIGLILTTSLLTGFLVFRIRDVISAPFQSLLDATERISAGDLSYRLEMRREDEFGVVARRFDSMVEELETSHRNLKSRLGDTELLLDVARIGATTLDLKDGLVFIARTVAAKLGYDRFSVYLFAPDRLRFVLEASSDSAADDFTALAADSDFVRTMLDSLKPEVRVPAAGDEGSGTNDRSLIGVPVVRDDLCLGIAVAEKSGGHDFSGNEVSILTILSHTIAAVIRNAELFDATKRQVRKLSLMFEMSKAVAAATNLDELLTRISEDVARLLSAKGCIIRLVEHERLRIKASFGLPEGVESTMEIAVGEGLAGWVAQKGSPLLVEDVSRLPEGMGVPVIDVKTVICVPLKIGVDVIGTIGLYDKYSPEGDINAFTEEDLRTVEGFASISAIAIERQRTVEAEVRRQRQEVEDRKRLAVLFDSVQGGIITLDRDFVITSANRYVEDWTGISSTDLAGRSCLDVFHEKIGICPHCAAKATFETGEINSIMQSRGVNYAELTSYPIRSETGQVAEAVVFIMDITERVLYQEETLSLYKEVIQTKDYLESIIGNSADAIVTTDREGVVTSWNAGAERIFGFGEAEVIGKFLPFLPDFLVEAERENIERILRGEVMRDIETMRRRKDGTVIEVSLTLSPIKDASGGVIGISGISRDISEKKRIEKELVRRNQEMSRLFFISSAMRGTLDLDRLLRMVLTAVTMSDGMGFNRAILFLVDDERRALKGMMGVGPASPEEAWKIWDDMSVNRTTLDDVMTDLATQPLLRDSFLERLTVGIEIPLEDESVLTHAVREKKMFNVLDVKAEALSDAILIQQLGTQAYAVVPLISRDRVIGLIWVDNYFNRKRITDEDMQFLMSFSNQVAAAIENARLFEKVMMAEQQLENIFESISDMVYFVDKDYVMKNVNRAVGTRLGLSTTDIIGKKCYEVIHGINMPFVKCPHHKTMRTKKAYIEELEDPHLGGTFLTSSSPIFDPGGEFIGSVHVVRDITELKVLREKLVMAEKMAALGEVAAKVAHEIRNPLVSVGGFAKRLEKKLEGNLQEYAAIIVREVSRLEGILREILGFVKEVRLAKETIDLNEMIEEVVTLMRSEIEDRGIQLERMFGPPAMVRVDPNRVKEAVLNIFTNAVQSLSGSGSIYIRTGVEDGDAYVEIEDTGRGIPESDLPNIFNPFFTTKSTGTGLGLAITHKIIQEHGGRIDVSSFPDKGTVFRVYLPTKEEGV